MERVLSDSLTAEIKADISGLLKELTRYDMSAPCLLYPVRHHSPVCSYQLIRTIAQYKPDIILIEGPENANGLMEVLTDEKTELPAAFYYYYKDTKKLVSEDAEDHKCYYPFLYSSPEYNAIAQANALGIPAKFIDLPFCEILINTKENEGLRREADRHSYADDTHLSRSTYYKKLCEKTGIRSFEEFWEKYFEIQGVRLPAEKFFVQMQTYCAITRASEKENDLKADATEAREQYMAYNIRQAMKNYKKVLVVTGGFHTSGLYKLINSGDIKEPKLHKISEDQQGCFPTAYSYEAADALHGYASGMSYPYFYDRVMKRLREQNSPEGIYTELTLDMLVRTAKESTKKDIHVSIADITSAKTMLDGLAALRNSSESGMAELADAITSTFIKGEKTLSSAMPLDIMRRLATGDGMGHIGSRKHIPPLVADFEEQCESLGIEHKSVIPKDIEVGLFSTAKGLRMSRFLHRVEFLGTDFAQMIKGPDLINGRDRSRVREEWKIRRTPHVDSVLTDCTAEGATIEEACITIAKKQLTGERRCETAAHTAVQCFLMGLPLDGGSVAALQEILEQDGDFFSVGKGMHYFQILMQLHKLYEFKDRSTLSYLIRCFLRLLTALPQMINIPEEQAENCISVMKEMYALTDGILTENRENFYEALMSMTRSPDKEPCVYGAAVGLLYAMQPDNRAMAENAMAGYLRSTPEVKKKGAEFLKGLFSTARDIILADKEFLKMTDELITEMDSDDFMEILPSMRLAFSYFTPAEIQQTAKAAALLHDSENEDLLDGMAVDEGLYDFASQLDKDIIRSMKGE